ncbi:MAG: amidase [Geitlerinemataceae cyanobacterium]
MNPIDLAFTPAVEQAKLIRTKAVSPLELVELYLERIDRLDKTLGSYFTVTADRAIADATAKTEQLTNTENPDDLPPFFGVPIPIKDLAAVKDVPWSLGVAALRQQVANFDTGVVSRIKQAGFVILGKTATSQLGALPYTEPPGFPPARNPWNLDYTPGGSSGGAAAAVAAGLCPVAQGSDGGGSVRGPAACCGLVGIKPSRGRISSAPLGEQLMGFAAYGSLARTVADAAALLDVMSGYIPGDPYWLPDPNPSFLEASRQSPGLLRIGVVTEFEGFGKPELAWEKAVLDTAKRLEKLGHTVADRSFNAYDLIDPFTVIWKSSIAAARIPVDLLDSINRWNLENAVSVGTFIQARNQVHIIARRIVSSFQDIDVLLLPTNLHSAIRIGEWEEFSPEETLSKVIRWIFPCPPFNATGQPSIALPAGFDDKGLPLSVQLVGRNADESMLISLASQLEADGLWSSDRPVFAV